MKLSNAMSLAVLICSASPAIGTTYYLEKFTCPIGGEKFTANVVGSNSTFGQRPDGRAYSPLPVDPIVECPKNGLLLIEEKFTPEELATLDAAIALPEYQAMRTSETQHYRAWWLMTKLMREPYQVAWQLQQASWESDNDVDRKVRYQVAFVAAATGLKRNAENADAWMMYQVRAANALRELGHFDISITLLDRIDKPEFLPTNAENAGFAREFIAGLRILAHEKNPASEPANLIPNSQAAYRCEIAVPPLTPVEAEVCVKPELAGARKQARHWIEEDKKQKKSDH